MGSGHLRSEVGAPAGELPRRRGRLDPCCESKKTWARRTDRPPCGLCGKRVGADMGGTGPSTLRRPSRLAVSLLKVGGWRLEVGAGFVWLRQEATGVRITGSAGLGRGLAGLVDRLVRLAARVGWLWVGLG